ncbi:MAG: hypothetical protein PHH49_07290 [Candidatus Omnitrophica bacterium]|nr:hypothetical protein [Candidatus Omnitrophota bacterium]MDD5488738.1 hypothetical protein [Candidatus Omnitrophota bacterium]
MSREEHKTKAIERIERQMEDIDEGSIRYKVLDCARRFKSSWMELGQTLFSVWKDKLYKEWGYSEFDTYVLKEIGIRGQTAGKLIRSYSFLEREEPAYLVHRKEDGADTAKMPTYEAVDVLRRAKLNKNIDVEDYRKIRENVLENGKEAADVRKELSVIIRKNEELEPEEARKKKREIIVKRFVNTLKSVRKEIRMYKMLPDDILREAEKLIEKIESTIDR